MNGLVELQEWGSCLGGWSCTTPTEVIFVEALCNNSEPGAGSRVLASLTHTRERKKKVLAKPSLLKNSCTASIVRCGVVVKPMIFLVGPFSGDSLFAGVRTAHWVRNWGHLFSQHGNHFSGGSLWQ